MTKPDAFAWHEVLHVASLFADHFETDVFEHWVVQEVPELRVLAGNASELLHALYARIGTLAPHMQPKKRKKRR